MTVPVTAQDPMAAFVEAMDATGRPPLWLAVEATAAGEENVARYAWERSHDADAMLAFAWTVFGSPMATELYDAQYRDHKRDGPIAPALRRIDREIPPIDAVIEIWNTPFRR